MPTLALVVSVREAMFHCGKSMIRSHLWEPDLWGPVEGLPTYGRALVDHAALDTPVADVEWMMDFNEQHRLYDGFPYFCSQSVVDERAEGDGDD